MHILSVVIKNVGRVHFLFEHEYLFYLFLKRKIFVTYQLITWDKS